MMTISLKADASGNSGSIQVSGNDKLIVNADGSLVATVNPATGVRSNALATMQKFADEFGASLAGNGYQKLPSGLIIQWGATGGATNNTLQTTSFPIAFPNACLCVVLCPYSAGSTATTDLLRHVVDFGLTSFRSMPSAADATAWNGTFVAFGH